MEVVNVSGLKNNPADVLRKAHQDLVLIMNRDRPDALMVGLSKDGTLEGPGVRIALATLLFRDGHLSLARSARLAEMALQPFVARLSRLGIPVVRMDSNGAAADLDTLVRWLASS
ncbi:MAG: UPF0175 family protein [Lewinella sp.]|nr:UPF0175 family protein [Lewinella sp.]